MIQTFNQFSCAIKSRLVPPEPNIDLCFLAASVIAPGEGFIIFLVLGGVS